MKRYSVPGCGLDCNEAKLQYPNAWMRNERGFPIPSLDAACLKCVLCMPACINHPLPRDAHGSCMSAALPCLYDTACSLSMHRREPCLQTSSRQHPPHLTAGISSRVQPLPGPALPLPGLCAVPHDKCTVVSCRWLPLQLQAAGLHTWIAAGSAAQQLASETKPNTFSQVLCRAARCTSRLHEYPAVRRQRAASAGSPGRAGQ